MKSNQFTGNAPSPKAAVFFAHIAAVKPACDLGELESFKIFKMGWDSDLLTNLLKDMAATESKRFTMLDCGNYFEVIRLPLGQIVGNQQS